MTLSRTKLRNHVNQDHRNEATKLKCAECGKRFKRKLYVILCVLYYSKQECAYVVNLLMQYTCTGHHIELNW